MYVDWNQDNGQSTRLMILALERHDRHAWFATLVDIRRLEETPERDHAQN